MIPIPHAANDSTERGSRGATGGARAWEWLERAVAERSHWLVFIDLEPRFDPFRSDPRWQAIRRAVGV